MFVDGWIVDDFLCIIDVEWCLVNEIFYYYDEQYLDYFMFVCYVVMQVRMLEIYVIVVIFLMLFFVQWSCLGFKFFFLDNLYCEDFVK